MTRTAWVFPGQGAQHPGMGREVYDRSERARDLFRRANAALSMDLAALCFEGDPADLTRTSVAQPALLAVGYIQAVVYGEQYELEPLLAAGHSLGEYTALAWAGALEFEDALRLVRLRGEVMEAADPDGRGTMAAIRGLDREDVARACEAVHGNGVVVPANDNAPDQVVISGAREAVAAASERLSARGAQVMPLQVAAAFHSPLMETSVAPFRKALEQVRWSAPRVPVVSNVDARPHEDTAGLADRLARQIVAPVRWWETVKVMERAGVGVMVESGPRSILSSMVRAHSPVMAAFSVDDREGRKGLEARLFSHHFRFLGRALGVAVSVPNRNWDEEAYERGVIEPVREVRAIYRRIVEEDAPMVPAHARRAFRMLEKVLETKQVQEEEARARLDALVAETGLEAFFSKQEA